MAPENRFGTGFGKPKFPERIRASKVLSDLVAEDSWYTMGLLQIDTTFLEEPVDSWSELPEYQASLANINSLNVINDCAERGVKLSSDFLSAAIREDHYQNVLQVVEEDRRSRQNLRKRKAKTDKLTNSSTYLNIQCKTSTVVYTYFEVNKPLQDNYLECCSTHVSN